MSAGPVPRKDERKCSQMSPRTLGRMWPRRARDLCGGRRSTPFKCRVCKNATLVRVVLPPPPKGRPVLAPLTTARRRVGPASTFNYGDVAASGPSVNYNYYRETHYVIIITVFTHFRLTEIAIRTRRRLLLL